WPLQPGTPNPVENPEINLLRNPADPFNSSSANIVFNTKQFDNTGTGATWVPFDLPIFPGSPQVMSAVHRIIVMRGPLTGNSRLILGTDNGVLTGVDNDGQFDLGIGSASTASGTRNGNLAITNFYYGDAQPSSLAAQIAGALFYGTSLNNANSQSDPN